MKTISGQGKGALLLFLGFLILAGCVPQRRYQDLAEKRQTCEKELKEMSGVNEQLQSSVQESNAQLEDCRKRVTALQRDTSIMSTTRRRLTENYNELHASYEQLKANREQQLEQSREEAAEILADLQKTQGEIIRQRDSLRRLEQNILEKEANLVEMQQELMVAQANMEEKQKHLTELQSILNQQDSVVNALKKTVDNALRGFEGEGLSIEERHGKIYVSMEEKLLFPSGRYDINPQGRSALQELAKVLESNPDINVMVEGHTDSVPFSGTGQLIDNWDLSVKRATTIVRAILEYGDIQSDRLIAAGRGEYVPIASNKTSEGRAKNRRTEIILTPKLDELFQIIESN